MDIQRLPPGIDPDRLAARFYPEPEARFVAAGAGPADRADRFVRLWARKEACVKAAGGRLVQGLRLAVTGPDPFRVTGHTSISALTQGPAQQGSTPGVRRCPVMVPRSSVHA